MRSHSSFLTLRTSRGKKDLKGLLPQWEPVYLLSSILSKLHPRQPFCPLPSMQIFVLSDNKQYKLNPSSFFPPSTPARLMSNKSAIYVNEIIKITKHNIFSDYFMATFPESLRNICSKQSKRQNEKQSWLKLRAGRKIQSWGNPD